MNGRHFWFGAVVSASFLLSACANLTWVGTKVYAPPETSILTVEDLGVDDDVAILNPAAFSITRSVANSSSTMAVPGGYTINETVIRWVFQSAGGSAGWVAGDPATHTVFDQDQVGPPLAPGEIQPISFGLIGPLPCGLYQEILTVDDADAVSESIESDNEGLHFFFVPSTQQFNIGVNILDDQLAHNHGTTNTHDFVVNPAGAPA